MLILALVRDFEFTPVGRLPVLSDRRGAMDDSNKPALMDIKVKKVFNGLVKSFVVNGEKVGMPGVWLPVRVRSLRTDA